MSFPNIYDVLLFWLQSGNLLLENAPNCGVFALRFSCLVFLFLGHKISCSNCMKFSCTWDYFTMSFIYVMKHEKLLFKITKI